MAVSFSAEYLYQGAKVLSRDPVAFGNEDGAECPEELFILARAVYSLGVFIIAPIGMLYHGAAAAIHHGRSFFAEERDVAPLNQLVEKHWEAVQYDGMALMTSCTGLIAVAGLVLILFFGVSDPQVIPLFVATILYPIFGIMEGEPAGNFFLTYGYAAQAAHFTHFLPKDQQQIYGAYYIYNKLVKQGIAIDGPLSEQEIAGISACFSSATMKPPFETVINLYQSLLDWNKVPPSHRPRLQAFVAKGPELRAVWESVCREAFLKDEAERNEFIARTMAEKVQPILKDLPALAPHAEAV